MLDEHFTDATKIAGRTHRRYESQVCQMEMEFAFSTYNQG
jgi:hypothetical protein